MYDRLLFKAIAVSSIFSYFLAIGMEESAFKVDSCKDGNKKPHSIVQHWHSHENDALRSLVESIVKYTVVPCHINSKYMGAFKGREQVVLTVFDDGLIQSITYAEFKNLMMHDENKKMTFLIDDVYYTVDGTPVDSPNSATTKTKKKKKFFSSIVNKIKKK